MNTDTNPNTQMIPASQLEALQKELAAVKAKDMVRLGDGAAFWIEEAGQTSRAFKAKVVLSEAEGHIAFIKDKPMICWPGYAKANSYANIEVVFPKTVIMGDGREERNPCPIMDDNKSIIAMSARAIGIGYSPTGALSAVDQTVYVDLRTLLIQEVQSKLKYDPTVATLGLAGSPPAEFLAYETQWDEQKKRKVVSKEITVTAKGSQFFIPTYGNMGYWISLSHPEIQAAMENFIQKQRFLDRSIITVLRRTILSNHSAIATKTPIITHREKGKSVGYIYVYGFRPESGDAKKRREDLSNLAHKLAAGEELTGVEITRGEDINAAEEAEVVNPISSVADPSEVPEDVPPPGFEDEASDYDYPEADTQQQGEPEIEPETEKTADTPSAPEPPPAEVVTDPMEDFKALIADCQKNPALQKAATDVRKEMKYSFAGLRSAEPEVVAEFVSKVRKAVS